jgi:4-carboxymuconolactone decarboxylase
MEARDSSPPPAASAESLPPLLLHGARALAATVEGRDAAARDHHLAALRAGVAPAALAEVARMAHLFGGFPRAIQGARALAEALATSGVALPADPEPASRSRADDRVRGEALFRRIYGESGDKVLALLDQPLAGYASWVLEDAYGRVLARPGLTPAERELLAVAALSTLRCPAQLESHVRGALRLGASRREVDLVIAAVAKPA